MWPMGPDIVEECQAVATLPAVDAESWAPLFEPADFNEAHGPLQLDDYRLSQEELRSWAERIIKIRAAIIAKAESLSEPQSQNVSVNDQSVRGRGLKRSRPSHNVEGRTERELREQAQ